MRRSGAPSAPRSKPGARPSPASAPHAPAIRSSPTTTRSRDRAAKPCGASPPSRRPPTVKLARTGGSGRRTLRDGEARAIDKAIESNRQAFEFALFCQWLADRQLGRAAERARGRGLEIGFYRDLAVGAAPDGAESWAHHTILARGVTIGAPPDPFSIQGQNWSLPAPNPLAGAREGWASLSALYRANMRHAGMLRIDHAMGLERLFLIPAGAKPAEGAYLSYPLDDLIGHIALESQRAQCMVIGEDLGTVPEGFRDRMTRANIDGMRVLWFERDGAKCPAAGILSAALGRLRRHPRSGDARRLVGRRRHRRAALARLPDPGQGRRGDRPAARGEARPDRRSCRRGAHRRRPDRRRPADRRHRRRRPCARRPRGLDPRPRPVRRSRRRDRPDQPARNRPRAAQLAPQAQPGRRRRLRQPPRPRRSSRRSPRDGRNRRFARALASVAAFRRSFQAGAPFDRRSFAA